MKYHLVVRYVETCLSCYVLDHCNGDEEWLAGVPVSNSDTYGDVMHNLGQEVILSGDKLPVEITDDQIGHAIEQLWAGENLDKLWDASLPEDDESGESAYAWFRFSWAAE